MFPCMEDHICSGCQSVSHQKLFFSELPSPWWSNYMYAKKYILHKIIEVTVYTSLDTLLYLWLPARQTHNVGHMYMDMS